MVCRLEEEGIITDCFLKTMGDCEILDFEMLDSDVMCKIILKASDFREVLADLDSSSDFVEFSISQSEPFFRITTEGMAGKFQVVTSIMYYLDYKTNSSTLTA